MKKYLDKGLSQLGRANAFFGNSRGDEADPPIDISSLTLEEALSQLQIQNKDVIASNRQLRASSDKYIEENILLKQQLTDLRAYVKDVEQDRAAIQDRYHRTQMQHKQSLGQLQQECDNLAQQMKDSQGENHALQGEVADLRFKLMMGSTEASDVPENTIQEWQAQKERMQAQLQAAQEKYFEILRREQAAKESVTGDTGMALDMAKLRAVEAELEDSKSQVSQLTERCEDLQKQVETLQSETPGLTGRLAQASGAQQQSTCTESDSAPAGDGGWGGADVSWGAWDSDQQAHRQAPNESSGSEPQGDSLNGKTARSVRSEAPDVTSTLRALLEQSRDSDVHPVVKDVLELLFEYGVGADGNSTRKRSNVADTTNLVGRPDDTAKDGVDLVSAQRVPERPENAEDERASSLEVPAAKQLSITVSPVHDPTAFSDVAQEAKGTPAHSTTELFDAATIAAGNSGPPRQLPAQASTVKLQVPLIAWEGFTTAELSRYLQILSAVSFAVSRDRKASTLSLQAQSETGENAFDAANVAALKARVRAAEDALVDCCSDFAQTQLHLTRSSQQSTLRNTGGGLHGILPFVRRLSGDAAAAPDTPVSDTGSPGVPSMSTLNKILHELLSEHQALLQCAEGSGGNASDHRKKLQKLARDAEEELLRLQALQSQQQDEVSIQWNEKQQLQSAAQHEIETARQELAVTQQENEMLRAQLEELESAHEQITCERDELHQQVETHTQMLSSPAALQNLATVQMMPRLDLGSDSTLTPTSNNQSTPTPHDIPAQGPGNKQSDTAVGGASPDEEASETPESLGANVNRELRARPEVPPLVSSSNAAATLHQVHRLGLDLRAAREQCDAANRSAQEARQRAEMLHGQLVDVTAERDDLLAGIDQIEEVASARIQQDEQMVERLMTAEEQLQKRTDELNTVQGQCSAQEEQLVELRTAMADLKGCVESARQRALQQEAELEELRSRAAARAVVADNGTAAVSAVDTPVESDADGGALGANELDGCGAVSDVGGENSHTRLQEAEAAAAAAHAMHDEALQLLEIERGNLAKTSERCDAQQQELSSLREEVVTLRQSAQAVQAELHNAKEELTTSKESMESVQDEKSLLEVALEGAQTQLECFQEQVSTAHAKLADAEKTVEQLRAANATGEEKVQDAAASQSQLVRAIEAAEQAETALEEQRLKHVADIEDLKAEATEMLKSGTLELQKALKNAQAQLQAVGADKAATTEKATQDVDALKRELQAREQQLESTQISLAKEQTLHQDQVQSLQTKIQSMDATAKKEVNKLQYELDSMNKRVEYLQKVNKEKRKEIEQLHNQLGTVQSSAAAADVKVEKATRELADARMRAEDLANKISQQEVSLKDLGDIKSILAKSPGASNDLAVVAQLEAMLSMAQSSSRLSEEVQVLRESASEAKKLRSENCSLSSRAAEDATATKRLQQELAQALSDLTASQDQLQVHRAELQRVQRQAKKDRVRYDTEMSKSDGLLESLPSNDVAQWPEPVQALVASQVSAAVEEARSLLQGEAEAAVEALEEQLEHLRQQLNESRTMAESMSERRNAAQQQSQHLESELKEQEAAMQEQIYDLQSQLRRSCTVDSVDEGKDAERRSWQDKCAELRVQVTELRQKLQASRAQAMLVLKEKQDEIPVHSSSGGVSQSGTSPPEKLYAVDPVGHLSPEKDADGLATEYSLSSIPAQGDMADYWKHRCSDLQKEVSLLQTDIADQMHVHELRDLADGAKAKEIQELQAVKSRSTIDVEYLKNIMIGFFEAGQLPHNEQVLVVLDRLLTFTDRDRSRVWKHRQNEKGIVASLFGT